MVEESSQFDDISQYTNGNMAEMIDEDEEAIKKDKQEFLYGYDGAMTVIRETEEPDDAMTLKNSAMNSAMSSRMQIDRIESVIIPSERASKDPVSQKPNHTSIVERPKLEKTIAITQMQNNHFIGGVSGSRKDCFNMSVSLVEELTAGMDSLEEPLPITPMMVSN